MVELSNRWNEIADYCGALQELEARLQDSGVLVSGSTIFIFFFFFLLFSNGPYYKRGLRGVERR